jgi:hypothetical protein
MRFFGLFYVKRPGSRRATLQAPASDGVRGRFSANSDAAASRPKAIAAYRSLWPPALTALEESGRAGAVTGVGIEEQRFLARRPEPTVGVVTSAARTAGRVRKGAKWLSWIRLLLCACKRPTPG